MSDNALVTIDNVSIAPIEDVAKFLIIAPEKAKAMQAEIRAIKKLGMAKEIYEQKREELRMVNELVLDAKVRMGELTMQIPKATAGTGSNQHKKFEGAEISPRNNFSKTKTETVEELGFSNQEVSKMERLARNKDLVEEEKDKARKEGRMPLQSNVLEQIKRDRSNKHYNGGGTKEYREQRDEIANIVVELYDETPVEFTVSDLVDEIIVNAKNYIRLLKNQISDHKNLITEETVNQIADAIVVSVLSPIEKIRSEIYEERA